MNKHIANVLFYLTDKGYGYLRLAGTREEFHFRAKNLLVDKVVAGDVVTFVLRKGKQGYYADGITKAGLA